MNARLFLGAASGLMLLGSTAVFAQSYATTATTSAQTGSQVTTSNDTGIITMKPGETVNTVSSSGLGSVQAGATQVEPNAGQPAT